MTLPASGAARVAWRLMGLILGYDGRGPGSVRLWCAGQRYRLAGSRLATFLRHLVQESFKRKLRLDIGGFVDSSQLLERLGLHCSFELVGNGKAGRRRFHLPQG